MTIYVWLQGKKRLIWMQPNALLADISVDGLPEMVIPKSAQGTIFIWDLARLRSLGYGQNRLAFLYHALQAVADELGDKFLLIEADSQTALKTLIGAGIELQTEANASTRDLQQMTKHLEAELGKPNCVIWNEVREWINYPQALPNGFFKFWKTAEQQLFSSKITNQNKLIQQRPHKSFTANRQDKHNKVG